MTANGEDLSAMADSFNVANRPRLRLTRASEIEPTRVDFLWGGRIPRGMLSIVCGVGGLGKSTATGALLTSLVTHGQAGAAPGPVLISSAEDDKRATIAPRLIAAGADRDLVHLIEPNEDQGFQGLTLPDDVGLLRDFVRDVQPTMVVIDPVSSHLAAHVDSHRDANIRTAIDPLATLAEETGAAIVVVAHLNKMTSGDLYQRLSGSTGFFNAARSVLLFAGDPEAEDEDPNARVLVHGKCNVGPKVSTLHFRVEPVEIPTADGMAETSRLVATGESHLSAHDALVPQTDEERTKTDRVAEWLVGSMSDGQWHHVSDLRAKAQEKFPNTSEKTLTRAAKKVKVERHKDGMEGGWQWRLPTVPPALNL